MTEELKQVAFFLDPADHQRIKQAATRLKTTQQELLRTIVEQYLARQSTAEVNDGHA